MPRNLNQEPDSNGDDYRIHKGPLENVPRVTYLSDHVYYFAVGASVGFALCLLLSWMS